VADFLKQAARIDHPADGVCIVFQLKRDANREDH